MKNLILIFFIFSIGFVQSQKDLSRNSEVNTIMPHKFVSKMSAPPLIHIADPEQLENQKKNTAGMSSSTTSSSVTISSGSPNDITTVSNRNPTLLPDDYPWMVAIFTKTSNKYLCAGTIIQESIVITSAHCVVIPEASSIYIQADSHQFNVRQIVIHNDYDHKFVNDIALLYLENSFNFMHNTKLAPISLQTNENRIHNYIDCLSNSWILKPTMKIQVNHLKIVSIRDCQQKIIMQATNSNENYNLDKSILCVSNNTDFGIADSNLKREIDKQGGSPLICRLSKAEQKFYLVGILSKHYDEYPEIYANIATLSSWIEKKE